MKEIVTVREVDGEGYEALLGQQVLVMCANYFYVGKLVGVNVDFVKLEAPGIVYETGEWGSKTYKDIQRLHTDLLYVVRGSVEAFCVSK